MFSSAFVRLFGSRNTQNLLDFTKFNGKAALGPWKKPLDFGGNQDHVTSIMVMVMVNIYGLKRFGPDNASQWVS